MVLPAQRPAVIRGHTPRVDRGAAGGRSGKGRGPAAITDGTPRVASCQRFARPSKMPDSESHVGVTSTVSSSASARGTLKA